MAVLEALVIVTLILAGVWVGYNAWEKSLTEDPYGKADAHDMGPPPHAMQQAAYRAMSHHAVSDVAIR